MHNAFKQYYPIVKNLIFNSTQACVFSTLVVALKYFPAKATHRLTTRKV